MEPQLCGTTNSDEEDAKLVKTFKVNSDISFSPEPNGCLLTLNAWEQPSQLLKLPKQDKPLYALDGIICPFTRTPTVSVHAPVQRTRVPG